MVNIAIHILSKVITTCDGSTLHLYNFYVKFHEKYALIERKNENSLCSYSCWIRWSAFPILHLFICLNEIATKWGG